MMEVAAHLKQPLSIDTNITYSLDMSKFPGLDDPEHKYQPALLIASPTEIIPSPTPDIQHEDLLGITDWQNSVIEDPTVQAQTKVTCSVAPPRQGRYTQQTHNSVHLQSNQHMFQPTKTIQQSFNSYQVTSSKSICGGNNLAKYALQAIFQNLIYPDVSRSQSFTLDTLVQSASSEPTSSHTCNRFQSKRIDYAERLRLITDSANNYTNSSYNGTNRAGKRKRSCDQSCDTDTLKRLRHDMSRDANNALYQGTPFSGHNQGRVLVHKRVRELLCQM